MTSPSRGRVPRIPDGPPLRRIRSLGRIVAVGQMLRIRVWTASEHVLIDCSDEMENRAKGCDIERVTRFVQLGAAARGQECEIAKIKAGGTADRPNQSIAHNNGASLPVNADLVDFRSIPLLEGDTRDDDVEHEEDQAEARRQPGHRHDPARPAQDALVKGAPRLQINCREEAG